MKQTLLKSMVLALYLTTVWVVFSIPELFSGIARVLILFVFIYCGIIVLAHLVSSVRAFSCWCVAASRERRKETIAAAPVEFETETEAT